MWPVYLYFVFWNIAILTYVTGSGKTRHFWQTKKYEFFMLIKSYNLSQLSAKILEGKTLTRTETGSWTGLYSAKQLNYRYRENINWISTSGIINVSVYLTAYSAYAIKLWSRFKRSCVEFFFSFQSVSEPVLSESLATLLDVVVHFQPEVSCRLHAIVSKLCRFFSCMFETPPIPRLLYFENERE